MSSQDFPTYGRGDEPEQAGEDHHYAKPAPYGGGTFGSGPQGAPEQGHYAPPQPYSSQPGQYGAPPGVGPGQPDPGGGPSYSQPPNYRPGSPYGPPAHPQQHELPTYGRDQPV